MRIALIVLLASVKLAAAQNALSITEVKLDTPTLHTIGVQVLIAGDVNYNAKISARAFGREVGTLFRVRPETVTGVALPQQFAGTIFDVSPGMSYQIELVATDPDGGGETRMVTATTRALPADPPTPRAVAVTNAAELQAALTAAQAGDIITLANGTYAGTFSSQRSGAAGNPIVIRGASQAGAIIDGGGCASCNIVELYGSYVHVERLTIRNGFRALRFLNATTANAVSRTKIEDVVHGISSAPGQSEFTICDNLVHGRLQWPLVYSDDGAIHADDQGIRVDGNGHVVCHNDISGFGDPLLNFASARAYDFYGNNIHEIYGDGTELDRGQGNVRLFGNRFTNLYTAISIQPALGGPVYVVRNEVTNVADEQIKLKMTGSEPSGALIYHNTFASPDIALNLQTPITQHDSVIANNLFIAPANISARVVDWTAQLERVVFDGNGYFPDTGYWFGSMGAARTFPTLAAAQAAGIEPNGRVLTGPIFDGGFTPPTTYTTALAPPNLTLAASSNAIDAAIDVPGINSRRVGAKADIGARERGCPSPLYGPRPEGLTTTNIVDCSADDPQPPPDGGDPLPPLDAPQGCCQSSGRVPFGAMLLVLFLGLYLMYPRR
ncbi:MAG: right-handed parallel beta-helix repeat-containing protein [Myxococcota bacterium]|nr:right-handed parallel beta-helix repeat-containing protein [Myxococcota bacterium]